jgi:hydroxymethylbilane synthase
MSSKIIIGSRGSKLALIQARSVADLIKKVIPEAVIEIKKVSTLGDRDRKTMLERWGEIGVFVKEIEQVLLKGEIDLAVHSLKDMPTDISEGLCLAAVTERLDPGDALVANVPLRGLPPGSRIGTGSLRRSVQLRRQRPDIRTEGIRGNMDTRLRKVEAGEFDGIIVAAAALERLGLNYRVAEYLNTADFLPAPGQGAIAVEARWEDREMVETASAINNITAMQVVSAERSFLITPR